MRLLIALVLFIALLTPVLAQTAAPLAEATAPVSVGLQMRGDTYEARVEVAQAAKLSLWCPVAPGLIGISGLECKAEVSYDAKAQTLQLLLQPGKYTITIRAL